MSDPSDVSLPHHATNMSSSTMAESTNADVVGDEAVLLESAPDNVPQLESAALTDEQACLPTDAMQEDVTEQTPIEVSGKEVLSDLSTSSESTEENTIMQSETLLAEEQTVIETAEKQPESSEISGKVSEEQGKSEDQTELVEGVEEKSGDGEIPEKPSGKIGHLQELQVEDEVVEKPSEEREGVSVPLILPDHQGRTLSQPLTVSGRLLDRPSGRLARRSYRRRRRLPTSIQAGIVILLMVVLVGLSVPAIFMVSYGIRLYSTYTQVKGEADEAMQSLLGIKDLLDPEDSATGGKAEQKQPLLDSSKLTQVNTNLVTARGNLTQIQQVIAQSDIPHIVNQYFPSYKPLLTSVNAATQMGIDLTKIGQHVVGAGQQLAPRFSSGDLLMQYPQTDRNNEDVSSQPAPALDTTSFYQSKPKRSSGYASGESIEPLVVPSDLELLHTTLNDIEPLLTSVQAQARNLSPESLPLDSEQKAQLKQYLALLPLADTYLQQGRELINPVGWLLGVDAPRTFLVQPMDSGELRATGGFTGQYGDLKIQGGRLSPIELTNIALTEYAANSPTYGELAPEPYQSWWPFANWGLRDSNLSADFPTSAKYAMERYHNNFGRTPEGVIAFTPTLIQHAIGVLGSLYVQLYDETITAENLEDKLHYYQLDGRGIEKEKAVSGLETDDEARKHFTATLAHTLMDRVRDASVEELLKLGQQAFEDLKTRDLQIYFSNPEVEKVLSTYGLAGEMNRSQDHDGLYIVQMNVSVSKAAEYVETTFKDSVTLDEQGGATHNLEMHFDYQQTGPVYGFDTYRNYVRVYVPEGARLLSGSGFDQGYDKPLCGGYLGPCPQDNAYPNNELICPSGGYNADYASPMLYDPFLGEEHPLNELGAPTNVQSDEPGRAMFGGYLVIPKNCALTVKLSWYVPPPKKQPYSLLVQRQAGTNPEFHVNVQDTKKDQVGNVKEDFTCAGVLFADYMVELKETDKKQNCSLRPKQ